jgi:hypothetical protein
MQNGIYGGIALFLVGRSNKMDYAMEGDAGHDMDEQTRVKPMVSSRCSDDEKVSFT